MSISLILGVKKIKNKENPNFVNYGSNMQSFSVYVCVCVCVCGRKKRKGRVDYCALFLENT